MNQRRKIGNIVGNYMIDNQLITPPIPAHFRTIGSDLHTATL